MRVAVNYLGPRAASVSFLTDATIDADPGAAIVVRVEPPEKRGDQWAVNVVRRESGGAEAGDGPHSRELARKELKL